MPWVTAFMEDLALPAGVFGPVQLRGLLRFMELFAFGFIYLKKVDKRS
jgi:hypothetical protein